MWKDHPGDPSTPDVFAGAGVPEKGDAVQKRKKKTKKTCATVLSDSAGSTLLRTVHFIQTVRDTSMLPKSATRPLGCRENPGVRSPKNRAKSPRSTEKGLCSSCAPMLRVSCHSLWQDQGARRLIQLQAGPLQLFAQPPVKF